MSQFYITQKKNLINDNVLKTYFYSRHFIQFDKTIYKNIEIVNPGELLEVNLNDYKLKKSQEVVDLFTFLETL